MDKYFGYILASYAVAFISIAILTAVILIKYRLELKTLAELKKSGVHRRSETAADKQSGGNDTK